MPAVRRTHRPSHPYLALGQSTPGSHPPGRRALLAPKARKAQDGGVSRIMTVDITRQQRIAHDQARLASTPSLAQQPLPTWEHVEKTGNYDSIHCTKQHSGASWIYCRIRCTKNQSE